MPPRIVPEMQIIREPVAPSNAPRVPLRVDRRVLEKRRWRGVADDGAEFGFDLAEPLRNGAAFFLTDKACYVIEQNSEPVLELQVAPADLARAGWMIGNLHFPIEVDDGLIRAADDPALVALFEREKIPFTRAQRVFTPLRVTAAVHHHHRH